MKRADLFVSVVFFLIAIWVLWQSTMLPHFSIFGPGPEFAPQLLASVLVLLSGILFVTTVRKANAAGESLMPDRQGISRIAIILVALFLYIYLMEVIGFGVTTFIYCLAMLLTMWKARWYFSVLVSAFLTGIFYWAFVFALDVPVPTGIFGI